jgi:glucose/arabinose dehydrogenase
MRLHLALAPLVAAILLFCAPLRAQTPLALELVVDGLQIPVFATSPPGDLERIFVLELYTGRIQIVRDGAVLPTPFLDLGGKIMPVGERGLLGMAFHPEYERNGQFFVFYSNVDGHSVLARHQVKANDPDQAKPNGEILLQIDQHFLEHKAGMLEFGPDGMLYVSVGDGGGALDPESNGQDLGTLMGSILRLDVDAGSPYGIPADNPFVGVPGAREEIWSYGLRNPWRFSIDPLNGSMTIADVGGDNVEEVTRVPAAGGANLGWSCMEASYCTGLPGCSCPAPVFLDPAYEYFHDLRCAIIGGYVYRGQDLPGFTGRYVFADWCSGEVLSLRLNGGQASDLQDHTADLTLEGGQPLLSVTSFGLDGRGELLVMSAFGTLHRVVSGDDCDGDGVSDADEIHLGTAFDLDGNGIPDECAPALHGNDIVVGETSWLAYLGAAPGQSVLFFGSVGDLGPGPCLVGNSVCLDIEPFDVGGGVEDVVLLAVVQASAQGVAYLPLPVSSVPPGLEQVAVQAVAWAGLNSVTSNPLLLQVSDR